MNYSHRFFLYAPVSLFLVLAAGVSIHWWFVADALAKRLDAWNGHEAMPGVTLHFARGRVDGFPFRLDVIFRNFEIAVATPHGAVRWQTEDLALHALTYGRAQSIFEAAGRQRLSWTDAHARAHSLDFETGAAHASAVEDGKGLSRFDLDIVDFGSEAFAAARAQFHIRRNPRSPVLDLVIDVTDIHLAPHLHAAFGDHMIELSISGTLAPEATFDGLREGNATWQSAAEAWRIAGGAFHTNTFTLAWDKLHADGGGALRLDALHRPEGILDFKIAGIDSLLSRSDVPSGPNRGIASALIERARKAGSNDAGLMGAIVGFKNGIMYVGDEPAGTVDALY